MATCAENLTKVVIECGGDDALIVAADADLDEAAEAAVWGACANAGQTCAGVERVYVEAPVFDAFAGKVAEAAKRIRVGEGKDSQLGPITMPGQIDIIRRQLDEALERGAKAIVGGAESIRPPYVDPVVLTDVPEDTALIREETFGPILPLIKVNDLADAVRRSNDSAYGLGAAIFSKDHGEEVARQLDVGMVSVNSVLTFAALPALPFGGKGESGFGRIHGEDGLREFTRPRGITVRRVGVPSAAVPSSFRRHPRLFGLIGALNRVRYSRQP
jgi:aldehyde dehydrogenase (NAD+)